MTGRGCSRSLGGSNRSPADLSFSPETHTRTRIHAGCGAARTSQGPFRTVSRSASRLFGGWRRPPLAPGPSRAQVPPGSLRRGGSPFWRRSPVRRPRRVPPTVAGRAARCLRRVAWSRHFRGAEAGAATRGSGPGRWVVRCVLRTDPVHGPGPVRWSHHEGESTAPPRRACAEAPLIADPRKGFSGSEGSVVSALRLEGFRAFRGRRG